MTSVTAVQTEAYNEEDRIVDSQWPPISFETLPWRIDPDEQDFIPKSRRRRISATYEAALPLEIAHREIEISQELLERIANLSSALARFDSQQGQRGYNLPALLLRSESAASSQIEHLTSSARNVALAEITGDAPQNARIIAGNIAAMHAALDEPISLSREGICAVHQVLMSKCGKQLGGELRREQVWIGGFPYSPHGAIFVPPSHERVPHLLDDLVSFVETNEMQPIVKAAVFHAQFETIHPFIDGNGRTGRALLHQVLHSEGILTATALPLSAGLLHNIDDYMHAILEYQQGNPLAMANQLVEAIELALSIGTIVAKEIDDVIRGWEASMSERLGSSIRRLPQLLAEQPVVNAAYLAKQMGISERASRDILEKACERGMLSLAGNRRRGRIYQADALLGVLEEISSLQGIRRTLASGKVRNQLN